MSAPPPPPHFSGNRNLLPSPFKKAGDPNYVYRQPHTPIWPSLPNPPLLASLLWECCPNEIQDKHKNKLMWKTYLFIFRRQKKHWVHTTQILFLCVQTVFTLSLSISIKCPKNLRHFFGESLMFIIKKHVTSKWTPANYKNNQWK